jgi:hypothetical protein
MKRLPRCKKLLFIMLFTNLKYSYCQQSILWNSIQLPLQLSSKWQVPVDFSYRTIGFSASAYQYTARMGVRRLLNDQWSVATGIAWFFTRKSFNKSDTEFGREVRLWQEALKEKKWSGKFGLQSRARIEERFFSATSVRDAYTSLRLRYRLGLFKLIKEKWRVQLSEEYMEQLISRRFSFQQNRLGISGAYIFAHMSQLQAGYIWSELSKSAQHFFIFSFQKTIAFHGNGSK